MDMFKNESFEIIFETKEQKETGITDKVLYYTILHLPKFFEEFAS